MGLFDAFGVGGGNLGIQVQFPQVQAGAVLQGVVTFTGGRRAQQITAIKLSFTRTTQQKVAGQPHPQQRTDNVVPAVTLSGPFSAQAGGSYQFPFQVQVPPDAFSSQPNVVSYRVSASADIDGEIDPGAGQEIQVIGTPMPQYGAPMGAPGMMPMGAPGMMPMGGPQPNWDQGKAHMDKGGYVDPAYAKQAYDKGGYVDPAYAKQAYDKGGYVDPGMAKQAYDKGGYVDPGMAKQAYDKGGYVDPGMAKQAYDKGGYVDPGMAKGYGGGQWAPGARAQAQWSDGGWYGVTVVEQNGAMVLVQWDDGTPASWVRLDQISG